VNSAANTVDAWPNNNIAYHSRNLTASARLCFNGFRIFR
jgi:hypothetical protein